MNAHRKLHTSVDASLKVLEPSVMRVNPKGGELLTIFTLPLIDDLVPRDVGTLKRMLWAHSRCRALNSSIACENELDVVVMSGEANVGLERLHPNFTNFTHNRGKKFATRL